MWQQIIDANLEPVYRLASSMTLDAFEREAIVMAAFDGGPQHLSHQGGPHHELLGRAARAAEEQQRERGHLHFERWDAQLLAEQPPDGGEANCADERELWRLRRRCLVTTLCCLPAGERVAFTLTEPLRVEPRAAAAMLGISHAALRVRASRARTKVTSFIGPRCALVDRRNPCRCGRLLAAGALGGVADAMPLEVDTDRLAKLTHEPLALFHCCNERPPGGLAERLLALA